MEAETALKAHDCDELRLNTQLVFGFCFLACVWFCTGDSIVVSRKSSASILLNLCACLLSYARSCSGERRAEGFVLRSKALLDSLAFAPYFRADCFERKLVRTRSHPADRAWKRKISIVEQD
jgi:hypothetical protein